MNRILAYLSLGVLFTLLLQTTKAQNIDYIRNSGEYYFGIGTGTNHLSARNNALSFLSESISVSIMSEFEQIVRETNSNLEQYTQGVIKTYSSTVVNRYQQILIQEKTNYAEVLVYIKKTEVEELFRQREKSIHDFIHLAQKAEAELRIDDALRYYYWALVLARSHPDNTKLRYNFGGNNELPLMLTLSDRIRQVFTYLRFEVISIEEKDNPPQKNIHMTIRYKGSPVQGLDYTYFTGDGISGLYSAKDGMGIATLDGGAASGLQSLRLDIEYQYTNKARLEPEVKDMIENVEIPYFASARTNIDISQRQHIQPQAEKPKLLMIEGRTTGSHNVYQTVNQVVDAITTANHLQAKENFTPQAWSMYQRLIASGKVTVLHQQFDSLRTIQVNDEIMLRAVPMLFAYNTSREKFIENVVFTFNSEGLINNLSFALSDRAISDILAKPEAFGRDEDKYFLIKFMEDFKTAYALKRIDYLNAIFDENALIIVGNIVKRTDEPVEKIKGMYGALSREEVEYIRLSKSEYMDRLKRVFDRNEFINIRFEENEVRKTQKDDKIYGIQIAQHYYSSTYADKGYLFLMIDLNDSLNPRIYVRTWQPHKNPDGSIYGLEDFRF